MATHPTRHADRDAEATVEDGADDGEVEESLDDRFTRLLEIGELEKQVRRRRRRMILFHHAQPRRRARVCIAALAQLGHGRGIRRAKVDARAAAFCVRPRARTRSHRRASRHTAGPHTPASPGLGNRSTLTPTMSQAVDTAPRANGRRGTGALLPCAERSAGFAKLSLSHARRAVNNRRTACTRHRRGQCVALTGVSIEWAVRPVPFRAGVGSLHPHQHALPTAARRPRSRHVRLVRARFARRARARAFVTAPFFASGAQRCLRSTTQR